MKRIILCSFFISILSLNNSAQGKITNDVYSNAQAPSVAQLTTLKMISGMMIEKMPAEAILLKLLPNYNLTEIIPLMLNIREMYNSDFSTKVLVDALIKNYNLSISETIQVIYIGYKYSNKEKSDATSWAYDFQKIITETYSAKNKSLQKFLKDSEFAKSELNISAGNIFSYVYSYLNATENPDRNDLFFRNLANAGFAPSSINVLCVLQYDIPELQRVKYVQFWTPVFCKGMFASGVTVYVVASALNYDLKINSPSIISNYLKNAGYGETEVLAAVLSL